MRPSLKFIAVAVLTTAATGCSSFLDVNTNPNDQTLVPPDAILAQALTVTAGNYTGNNPSFNSYASWAASYWGKSGVVSGYGEELTYNYSSLYYQGLWNNTYDNLNDYAIIQTRGADNGYPNHAAIARIMKVYNFQLLVDEYGDIPYSQALEGSTSLNPTYDKAADIYKDFIVQLDGAIADINKAASDNNARTVGAEDIVFGGDMKKWKAFANSLKLRVLLRESQTNDAALDTYVKTQMTALQTLATASTGGDGFIMTDVVVQPNYSQNAGQQNPLYNRYAFTAAGQNATERSYQIPTQFILDQYLLNKDPRIAQLYTMGARTTGTAPNTVTTPEYIGAKPGEPNSPNFVAPLAASRFLGSDAQTSSGGIIKGLNAPTVLMLLSEQLFSKAEAETRGLFTGGDAAAKSDFQDGIKASFQYTYRSATAAPAPVAETPQYTTYITNNPTNPLVSYDAATTNGGLGKQAVILYQKYLAMNSIASTEAWDDYRRAAQPNLPASSQSSSPRADKLPTRLLYPQTEVSTNAANIPANVTQFTKIFWDVVD